MFTQHRIKLGASNSLSMRARFAPLVSSLVAALAVLCLSTSSSCALYLQAPFQQPQQLFTPDNATIAQLAISNFASTQQQQQQQQQQQAANNNQFVIKWLHTDNQHGLAYVSIVPVNYTNLHEPKIELRYISSNPFVTVDERARNGTVVAAVVVTDDDTGPNGQTTISIERGNELNHFKLVSTPNSNTIQVNGAPLDMQRAPEYNLTIVCKDHGSPPRSSSATLIIKISNEQGLQPTPDPSPILTPPNDLMYIGAGLVLLFFAIILLIIFGCALFQNPKLNKASRTPSIIFSR